MKQSINEYLNTIKIRYFYYLILFIFGITALYQLDLLRFFIFDEYYYVPAARDWLNLKAVLNLEHPPLGKYFIAFGIKIFGNNPMGWRMMSVIFGALVVLMIFKLANLYFKNIIDSLFTSMLAIFNFWIFVFSRMATLEIFLILFFISSIYFFYLYYLDRKERDFFLLAFFIGLSISIKWSGVFFGLPIVLMIFILEFKKGYVNLIKFILIVLLTYYLTFIPFLFLSEGESLNLYQIFISNPIYMLNLQNSVNGMHPYISKWYTWPFMIRPIWFVLSLNKLKSEFSGIMLIGNPIQMLLGLFSFIYLTFKWKILKTELKALLIIFFSSWILWGLVQRNVSFLYYFFPNALLYTFFIPLSIKELFLEKYKIAIYSVVLIVSVFLFIHFYPLLTGQWVPLMDKGNWIWFRSWI